MELGREWKVVPLPKGDVALQAPLASVLRVKLNDTVYLRLNASRLLEVVMPQVGAPAALQQVFSKH